MDVETAITIKKKDSYGIYRVGKVVIKKEGNTTMLKVVDQTGDYPYDEVEIELSEREAAEIKRNL